MERDRYRYRISRASFISPIASPEYWTFDDGSTYMRKGVMFVDPDQKFGVDIRLTDSPGFGGVEDTDFEMIYPIII